MKKYILILFLVAFTKSFAQVNQLDTKGKKHGKHVRYLDKFWNALEDSSKAVYFRYTFYDHGAIVHPMGGGGANKLWKMKSTTDTSIQKGIKILNGEYKWHDPKGRLMYWHSLKDGFYVWYKEYYETGELHTFFDYTKHADGQPWSWYLIEYNKDGSIKHEEYTKKDEKGNWPLMKG